MLQLTQLLAEGEGSFPEFMRYFPFVAVLVIMYFLLIAPQRRKEKRRQGMLRSIEKNDRIITIGGIHGVVKSIGDRDVTLLVDKKHDTMLKLNRSAIYTIVDPGDEGELSRNDNGNDAN